ncbi:MAG: sigma-54 dependent transcriptional regulator [Candidatus Sulfotelmatobacter sp.]|jgi:sigma-54-specific transcriptional regulator
MSLSPVPKPLLGFPSLQVSPSSLRASALLFEDLKSKALLDRIHLIGPSAANVLVTGETGTGKELIARHVHKLSPRADGPFVAVNCGAFSESLVESELFGHERGSFTGATVARAGWFEAARGGTLFLDEIGDLPFAMQVKLLRVLQERQVVRLGSRSPVAIDVRVVAATNVNLEDAVAAGRFREDLYYRLQVATLHIPPLRERPGDILPLAQHFLGVYGERLGLKYPALSAEAVDVLVSGHSWPGNTRELENVIHHALLVCRENVVQPEDLRLSPLKLRIATKVPGQPLEALHDALIALFEDGRPNLYADIETAITRTAYEFCHRNQVQTARLLGISRNIVRAKLMQCGELPNGAVK